MVQLPVSVSSTYRTLEVREAAAGRLREGARRMLGDAACAEGIITLEANQKPAEKANSLLHEFLHQWGWETDIGLDDEDEERVVRNFANAFCSALSEKRNPAMRAYLIEALRDG